MQHVPCLLSFSFAATLLLGCETPPPATIQPTTDPEAVVVPDAQEHYARALELDAAGRPVEAGVAAEQALAAGGGRDAALLAAKLAIVRDDLSLAEQILRRLAAAEPSFASARYNLGLVAHRRGEFNGARTEYLAALRADPRHAAARYNLTLLTWGAGVKDEARHHALKFIELAPDDPRSAQLRTRLALAAPSAIAP